MLKDILYYSTNHNSEQLSFRDILMKGQAPDKGLYMPSLIPKLSFEVINSMNKKPYDEIAFVVTNEFLKNETPTKELKRIAKEAYNFEIPFEKIKDRKYIMRMDQGPTASFKDFAARMISGVMNYLKGNENLTILTATSGDTGSAVANTFYDLEGMRMVVLFPYKEVSDMQRKQITTLGKNIIAVAIEGKFDDCQSIVKQAFSDSTLRHLNLSSTNSINFGRLLPQAVYYFYAYSRLKEEDKEKVIFSVPSGNFGNLTGGLIAKRMGLPAYKFIAAVNENDEFPKFLETGIYESISPSKNCLSNAMNVGHPSNLARIFDLYGGWINEDGIIIKMPDMNLMRKDIFSISICDEETRQAIKDAYKKYKILIEPHGAVGWKAIEKFIEQNKEENATFILSETAHPAKFSDELEKIIGVKPELPKSMQELNSKKEEFKIIPADYEIFKEFLLNI